MHVCRERYAGTQVDKHYCDLGYYTTLSFLSMDSLYGILGCRDSGFCCAELL
jgi:hypothetical protein